jgi:hypothetical protein
MKNIHILPTDKPSRLYFNTKAKYYAFSYTVTSQGGSVSNRHIYITDYSEIKEGDWFMSDFNSFPIHNIKELSEREGTLGWEQKDLKNNLKIILTTDQDLIKDGVQAINDEFLEWFVKNPSCEEVKVEHERVLWENGEITHYKYNIIFPKKEVEQNCEFCKQPISKYGCACAKPKEEVLLQSSIDGEPIWGEAPKQKTLEDFCIEFVKKHFEDERTYNPSSIITAMIVSGKWQAERMYSEEDIKPLLSFIKEIKENWDCDDDAHKYSTICRCCDAEKTLDEWFEKFKNK